MSDEIIGPPRELIAALQEILTEYSPSCLVADARLRQGVIGGFAAVRPEQRIVGPALTVDFEVDNLADHPTVLARARPGDVLLLACHGQTHTAMWGGLMSTLARRVGLAACVVDGAVRDVDEIRDGGFPVWHRGVTPRPSPTAVHGRTEPVLINVPVIVQGVVVQPGDILVCDENGIAVVPPELAEDVLATVRLNISRERTIRDKIDSGVSVADLFAEFGHT